MIPNQVKRLWSEGKTVLNGWLSIPSSFNAEIIAAQGYDSITIDQQHGLIDQQAMVAMLQAMRASGVTPMVRVAWLDPAKIMKALDAGAYGVICPVINTRAEAETLVSYVRYPPVGIRSFGPVRALISAGADYAREANDQLLCIAMIETREGYGNLEAIVSTPGLDAVLVGPSDLAFDMGFGPGMDREEPEMLETFQRIVTAAHEAGIKAVFMCGSAAYAERAARWGYDMVTVGQDIRFLVAGAQDALAQTRLLVGR
ncbi:aldolase/citrate lyase family protein [Sphingomonas oligophenolica]|uniref:Aldolase/citrate lyase family protein n=1 Tax=Sphingomonas oligophenolica TaxID=301154 RepID=A0ABU9YCU6_9SPHN